MNRVALVTGASRGIGRAIAAELAEAGHAVCINYLTHRQEAETLAEKIRNHGGNAIAVQADVADRAAVETMVRTAEAELGPVSLLVNNAGIAGQIQFQDITDAQWNRYLGVNLGGARNTIQAVLPHMLHEKAGCIVNISSIWGLRGASCEVAYACTKAALVGLTRSLALELAPSHLQVSRELEVLLRECGYPPKSVARNGSFITYFKQSDQIEDFLTLIGAPVAAMSVMSAKLEKDLRNSVNRRLNCDSANLDKAVEAAQEQLESIRKLQRAGLLDQLPDKLQLTAALRLENPELTLSELAEEFDPPVTKSCLNHRLRKITQLAKGL